MRWACAPHSCSASCRLRPTTSHTRSSASRAMSRTCETASRIGSVMTSTSSSSPARGDQPGCVSRGGSIRVTTRRTTPLTGVAIAFNQGSPEARLGIDGVPRASLASRAGLVQRRTDYSRSRRHAEAFAGSAGGQRSRGARCAWRGLCRQRTPVHYDRAEARSARDLDPGHLGSRVRRQGAQQRAPRERPCGRCRVTHEPTPRTTGSFDADRPIESRGRDKLGRHSWAEAVALRNRLRARPARIHGRYRGQVGVGQDLRYSTWLSKRLASTMAARTAVLQLQSLAVRRVQQNWSPASSVN